MLRFPTRELGQCVDIRLLQKVQAEVGDSPLLSNSPTTKKKFRVPDCQALCMRLDTTDIKEWHIFIEREKYFST